jgi:hypothetical protein
MSWRTGERLGRLSSCWSGGDKDVLIPSVFIGKSDGEKIIEHYTYQVGA